MYYCTLVRKSTKLILDPHALVWNLSYDFLISSFTQACLPESVPDFPSTTFVPRPPSYPGSVPDPVPDPCFPSLDWELPPHLFLSFQLVQISISSPSLLFSISVLVLFLELFRNLFRNLAFLFRCLVIVPATTPTRHHRPLAHLKCHPA